MRAAENRVSGGWREGDPWTLRDPNNGWNSQEVTTRIEGVNDAARTAPEEETSKEDDAGDE